MNFSLNLSKIKKLCGSAAYKKGQAYFQAGKVELQKDAENESVVKAVVKGRSEFRVTVRQQPDGEIQADCSCPPVGFVKTWCQHIAGALLTIEDKQQAEQPLAERMLDLFGHQTVQPGSRLRHFDSRKVLKLEFVCSSVSLKNSETALAIRMNAGTKEWHEIRNAKEFLGAAGQGGTVEYSPGCFYSPDDYSLDEKADDVLRLLQKSREPDEDFGEGSMIVTAAEWERLLPVLLEAPFVKTEQDGTFYEGIRLGRELPLSFFFDSEESGGYCLIAEGLEQVTALPAYGMVLAEGKFIKMAEADIHRLAELKKLIGRQEKSRLSIRESEIDHFMETVIPGLKNLGEVVISEAVSERFEETPLKAKLYLDRIRHKLLAGLEFQYGQLVINPCEEQEGEFRHLHGIRRQRDAEQRIMQMMQDSAFTQTDGGFYMQDEEAEYDFLYHAIPELEKLVQVYATTAVKLRIERAYRGPKIKVEVTERTDWLAFRFDMKDIPESEIKNLLASLEEKRKYYRIPNGTLMSLETPEFLMLADFLKEMELTEEQFNGEEIRVPLIRGLQLVGSLEEKELLDPGSGFAELLQQLAKPETLDDELPATLAGVLRPYQKAGFSWFRLLSKYGFGGILADDMGLGKTLQSIAFLVSALPDIRARKLPAMIVAPSSLVYNWLNELQKFAPEVKALIIDGDKAKREQLLKQAEQMDLVITSYPLLRMDQLLYRGKSFHTLFLDEAQAFKNPVTQTAKAVRALQAEHRFALTGTPVENSLDELWSIFQVVFPELLPNRRVFSEMRREQIAKRVRPFILRRVKKDVLQELPAKTEVTLSAELQRDQKKLYAAYLAELKQETLKHLNKDSFQKNRIKILAGLTRLRQLCCHPALFVEGYDGGSAKFDQLMEILEESRLSGRRVLVFSQFTQMLGLIGRQLARQGIPYFYLDGQTPGAERVELCNRFNEGEGNLFLISLKAGGTGLNLTGADTVVLYDLWWNPAVEQQAADRAHRMGQKNEVQVIRLIAKGTIEEKITQLQEKKKHLIDEIVQSGSEPLTAMTAEDIREILMA